MVRSGHFSLQFGGMVWHGQRGDQFNLIMDLTAIVHWTSTGNLNGVWHLIRSAKRMSD